MLGADEETLYKDVQIVGLKMCLGFQQDFLNSAVKGIFYLDCSLDILRICYVFMNVKQYSSAICLQPMR